MSRCLAPAGSFKFAFDLLARAQGPDCSPPRSVARRGLFPVPGQPAVPEGPRGRASLHLQHGGDRLAVWVSSKGFQQRVTSLWTSSVMKCH